jgi:hypothetical protein
MSYTDPRIYFYDEVAFGIYVIDDFGNAVRVPSRLWYCPPIWSM